MSDTSIEQLWYTWSDVGLSSVHAGFRVRAASPGLTAIYSQRVQGMDRYMRYLLPPGADRSVTPEQAPVGLAFVDTGHEYILVRKNYSGKDGVGRVGNFFVHVIALGENAPYLSVEDAIWLWDAGLWRTNDQELDRRSNRLEPIAFNALHDNPRFDEQFAQERQGAHFRQALPFLIEAYLTRRERSPLYLASPAYQSAQIASLIAGLVNCLPRQLLEGLTFSTYEPDVTKATAQIVGTSWIVTPGQETASAQVFSPQFYREKLAINCFTEERSPLRDHPQAIYNHAAADFAGYATDCLVTGDTGQLYELLARAEESQGLNIALFLQLYKDVVVNVENISLADIERYLTDLTLCRDRLSNQQFRKKILTGAVADRQWSKDRLESILRSLRDRAKQEQPAAAGYISGPSAALSVKQEQATTVSQGVCKRSQRSRKKAQRKQTSLAEALLWLAQDALPPVVNIMQGRGTSASLPKEQKVQIVLSLLSVMDCCLLPQAAPAVWKDLLDRIQQDQNAIKFLVAHWDIHAWLLGTWNRAFPVDVSYDEAVRPLVIVPWERLGAFLKLELRTQWNVFTAEKLVTDSSLTPQVAQQLGQSYAGEINGLLKLLLRERDSTLAANFLIRLVEPGYPAASLPIVDLEALLEKLLRTDPITGDALLDLLVQYGYPQKKNLVNLLLRNGADLVEIVERIYPTVVEQHKFFLYEGPGYLRVHTQGLITLYKKLLRSHADGKMARLLVLLDVSPPQETLVDLLSMSQLNVSEYVQILKQHGKSYLKDIQLAGMVVDTFTWLVNARYSDVCGLFFAIVTSQTGYQYIEGLLKAAGLQLADQLCFLEYYGASYLPYCSQMPIFNGYIITYIRNFNIDYLAQLAARAEARNFFTALTQNYRYLDEHIRQPVQDWQIIDSYGSRPTAQPETLNQLAGALYRLGLPNNGQFRAQLVKLFVSCINTPYDFDNVMDHMKQVPQIEHSIWQFLSIMAERAAECTHQQENDGNLLLPYLVCALTVEEQASAEQVASVHLEHFRQEFLDTLLVHVNLRKPEAKKMLNDLLERQGLSNHGWTRWNEYLKGLGLSEMIRENAAGAAKTPAILWLPTHLRNWPEKIKQLLRAQLAGFFVSRIRNSDDLNKVMTRSHISWIRGNTWQFLYFMAERAANLSQSKNKGYVLLPYLAYALTVEEQIGYEKVSGVYTEHFRQEFLDTLLCYVNVQDHKRWDELDDLLKQRGLSDDERERWNNYLKRLQLSEGRGNGPVNYLQQSKVSRAIGFPIQENSRKNK
jgi:hypothetical protein